MRKFYNEELQHRYDHDAHFREKVDRSEVTYSKLLKKVDEGAPL